MSRANWNLSINSFVRTYERDLFREILSFLVALCHFRVHVPWFQFSRSLQLCMWWAQAISDIALRQELPSKRFLSASRPCTLFWLLNCSHNPLLLTGNKML